MMPNPHPQGSFWYAFAERFGSPDIKYCEETIASFVSEPSNTWSNLFMIVAGLLIHYQVKKQNKLIDYFGVAFTITGTLSFIYHLSNIFPLQFTDFLGMYCSVGMILFINLKRLKLLSEEQIKKYYLLSFIPFTIVVSLLRHYSLPVQASITALVVTILICELVIFVKKLQPSLKYKPLMKGLFFIFLASLAQMIDINRLYCDSQNHILQPHAFWHIFNAFAFYNFYFYFRAADDLCNGSEVA